MPRLLEVEQPDSSKGSRCGSEPASEKKRGKTMKNVRVRKLTLADMDATLAFARRHFIHSLNLDQRLRELTVRESLAQQVGYFIVAETEEGFQAMAHCMRKAPEPPFDDHYFFAITAADRERDGRQGLDAVLSIAMDSAVAEANVSETTFYAFCDVGDTVLEGALRDADFIAQEVMEMGMLLLTGARELPAPEGMTVRPVRAEDAARISEMSITLTHPLQWLPESWVHGMMHAGAIIFVVEVEGRVVGAAGGRMVGEGKAIGLMNMLETDHQGKGIGSFLFNKYCLALRAKGAQKIPALLESEKHRRFYQRVGWERVKDLIVWKRTECRAPLAQA